MPFYFLPNLLANGVSGLLCDNFHKPRAAMQDYEYLMLIPFPFQPARHSPTVLAKAVKQLGYLSGCTVLTTRLQLISAVQWYHG